MLSVTLLLCLCSSPAQAASQGNEIDGGWGPKKNKSIFLGRTDGVWDRERDIFPGVWKYDHLSLLRKGGGREDLNNYHPISKFTCFAKLNKNLFLHVNFTSM